ncbi:8127_t:CDS:2 [Ambispora gerdemannii]|uniref:8127_t:CDS:1 n=1 Tax=Ambispora gerdemannii TaxID=144530 RepID=A0A9N9DZR5_9GLOM|nr:8127_t:CDS:2 [Ambispora gerdemannii]
MTDDRTTTDDNNDGSSDFMGRTKLLGTFSGIGNNCNNMIGAGIFSSPGLVLSEIQSPGIALILWFVGGIAALFGSLSYTELGSSILEGGGEIVYLERAYPRPQALFSYMFSFAMIVAIRPASMCAIANVFAQYFLYLLKAEERCDIDYLHPKEYIVDWQFCHGGYNNNLPHYIQQMGKSNKSNSHNNKDFDPVSDENTNWKHMFPNDMNISGRSLTAALIPILFAYSGWGNLNYTLDEFVDPKKKLFMSNSISVGIVTFLYLCANIAYTNVPLSKITGNTEPSEIIAGRFAFQVGGFNLARALSFFICLSAFGALAANVWAGSRVIVAAAKRNYIPFSSWLQKWNGHTDTPIFALLTQAVWSSLIIIFYPHNDPFKFFINVGGHCMWIFLFLSASGLLFLRYSEPELARPFKVFILIPIIFIMFSLFIIIGSFVDDSTLKKQQLEQPETINDRPCKSAKYAKFNYHLPYIVSLAVVGVSAICWYFLYELDLRVNFELRRTSRPHGNDEKWSVGKVIPMEVTGTNDTFESGQ